MKRIRTGRDLACRWSGIMLQSRRSQEIESISLYNLFLFGMKSTRFV
uniref:Uncharacterized protein n=1 Tax=Escherichia coli TaxID=562 RepID=A0A075MAJ1_ECOLX|nr:hypothetical protein [Escherichia coli]AIF79268.1 hypothetical protein [Escherichia coli]UMW91912.1 hypothetical protein [Escherichia coli]